MSVGAFNHRGVWSIYRFEMYRFARTIWTGLATPVITTSLYFIVFGAAIGSRITDVSGVGYGAFIVPGLMMLSLFTESIFNASFGIHMPRFLGTIYEPLSAPLSPFEIVLGYVGAAVTKAMSVALVILATANLFVDIDILHPVWMLVYLLLVATTFCLFGFIVGIWAKGFEMLPEPWRTITLFNPVVYLISGFRWTFYGAGDVGIGISLAATFAFLLTCLGVIWWIFRTGYRLKS
jgi:ABC-2 type transport system permease protein